MSQGFVTLVAPADTELARWKAGAGAGQYDVIKSIDLLEDRLRSPIMQAAGDYVRVVIDGGATLDRFLYLVSALPESFRGEVLYIAGNGSGYLSTRELKTVRTVRTLSELDVEVFLRWHGMPARSRTSYPRDTGIDPRATSDKPR